MFVLKIKNLAMKKDQNMPFTVEPRNSLNEEYYSADLKGIRFFLNGGRTTPFSVMIAVI